MAPHRSKSGACSLEDDSAHGCMRVHKIPTAVLEEMPIHCLHVKDVALWYHSLGGMGLTGILELDFNCVRPDWVPAHMREASAWVYHRKKWRASKVTRSVHCTSKKLDRAG